MQPVVVLCVVSIDACRHPACSHKARPCRLRRFLVLISKDQHSLNVTSASKIDEILTHLSLSFSLRVCLLNPMNRNSCPLSSSSTLTYCDVDHRQSISSIFRCFIEWMMLSRGSLVWWKFQLWAGIVSVHCSSLVQFRSLKERVVAAGWKWQSRMCHACSNERSPQEYNDHCWGSDYMYVWLTTNKRYGIVRSPWMNHWNRTFNFHYCIYLLDGRLF